MSSSAQPVSAPFDHLSRGAFAVGAGLLAVSAASIAAYSTGNRDHATLLLTYAGGMAMLLTQCRFPVVLGICPSASEAAPGAGSPR